MIKSTYNMLSRTLSKMDHYILALHIMKEGFPDAISTKVLFLFFSSLLRINRMGFLRNGSCFSLTSRCWKTCEASKSPRG